MKSDEITLHRGLQGVYFDRSATTFIDGKKGVLEYRGYNIHDLAEHSTFEETAYLLIYGNLPTKAQLHEFDSELKAARELPEKILDVIDLVKDSHPMDVLRTAVSALASFDSDRADNSPEATIHTRPNVQRKRGADDQHGQIRRPPLGLHPWRGTGQTLQAGP